MLSNQSKGVGTVTWLGGVLEFPLELKRLVLHLPYLAPNHTSPAHVTVIGVTLSAKFHDLCRHSMNYHPRGESHMLRWCSGVISFCRLHAKLIWHYATTCPERIAMKLIFLVTVAPSRYWHWFVTKTWANYKICICRQFYKYRSGEFCYRLQLSNLNLWLKWLAYECICS